MIRHIAEPDIAKAFRIINAAAEAYRGVIPADCWHDPYMPLDELAAEIAAGVAFTGYWRDNALVGLMGLQDRGAVALIRHAYVDPGDQGKGIGGALLNDLTARTEKPILVGTWAAATWAIRFYERHGFTLVDPATKDRLLRRYWAIPDRQIETSVVLAGPTWRDSGGA